MAYRYPTKKVNGKTVLVSRWIMEKHLGRKLARNEHVHHKNENPFDNRLENLEVLTAQQHAALHKTKYPKVKTCMECGIEFTPHPTKRKRQSCCNKTCATAYGWKVRRRNALGAA